jgi:hypothetical protein
MAFQALTDQVFCEHKEQDYWPVALDLGYAGSGTESCGIAWKILDEDNEKEMSFGEAVKKVAQILKDTPRGKRPLLIVEAPLSTRHLDGCPAFRGRFEEPREKVSAKGNVYYQAFGWYHGAGAATTLGATRFIRELAKLLQESQVVYLAEAFLSDKKGKTAHADDAAKIRDEFWNGKAEDVFSDNTEPLIDCVQGIPCVRVFA